MNQEDRRFSLSNYPLSWPEGWHRTAINNRKNNPFKTGKRPTSVLDGVGRVVTELERMQISRDDVLISTNIPTRIDGFPRSDQAEPSDPGVAVYWRKGQDAQMQCMAIDIYGTVAGNLAAIAASLEALRAIERHGGAQVQERTFRGFAALPASTSRPWRDVFGVIMSKPTVELVEAQFKSLMKVRHPDAPTGSNSAMAELNQARKEALAEIGELNAQTHPA
jgi:hypothetical protein